MPKLHTIYDFRDEHFITGFSLLFLIPVIIGAGIFLYNFFNGDVNTKTTFGMSQKSFGMLFGAIFALLSLGMFCSSVLAVAEKYYSEKSFYDDGKCKIVEGIVENYHPMPAGGHDTEHFDVKSVHFDFTDYSLGDMGYNTSASHGGVIKAGLYVRLWYVASYDRNAILRIEIR
jgi:hypothetical protein